MRTLLDRFSFLVVSLAGWMNQHQQYGIHYLIEENRVLREQIGNRRMRFIKEECLEQMIFFGEDWLRSGVRNFVEYDHHEGNHQGLDNRLVIPMKRTVNTGGRIQRRQRLGGLLNYYCRAAQIILPRYRHLNWLQFDIRGFEVAVDDAFLVCGFHSLRDLLRDAERFVHQQGSGCSNSRLDAFPPLRQVLPWVGFSEGNSPPK